MKTALEERISSLDGLCKKRKHFPINAEHCIPSDFEMAYKNKEKNMKAKENEKMNVATIM